MKEGRQRGGSKQQFKNQGNGGGNNLINPNNQLIITSPLNKSKQDVFSQTGKLTAAQLE